MRHGSNVILDAIRKAAKAGERCPQNPELEDLFYSAGGKDYRVALNELTSSGKLRLEICGKNWRVAYLPDEGLSTAGEPNGAPAWRRIDQHGARRLEL